jgi:phytoene dehydrogenase-like protein
LIHSPDTDAIVVGSGPNGLAAAITLAREKLRVLVLEAEPEIGGAVKTEASTLPGFLHDACASVLALAPGSPFFGTLALEEHGVAWVRPDAPLAHALEAGEAVVLERSIEATAAALGADGRAWASSMRPLVEGWSSLAPDLLAPLHFPRHPLAMARFGWTGLRSARSFARARFAAEPARALFAGLAAHSFVPLDRPTTAAFGQVLGASAHADGWPFARGGSRTVIDALAGILRGLGGRIETNRRVRSLDELPGARAVLLDVTPRQLLAIAGARLPASYRRKLEAYRYGPAAYKIDYALSGPIPWTANACSRAGVVHIGGDLEEIARAARDAWDGAIPERPFVLVAQPTLFDPSRAPLGQHTAWAYAHVPHACDADLTDLVERRIERFAPGFRALVLARSVRSPRELERRNANLVGGDITGGAQHVAQLFARPVSVLDPYATPIPGLFLCSSSTPPGGGVHGMCGHLAARRALRDLR